MVDAEEFLRDLIHLVNSRAQEPDAAARVSALSGKRIGIAIFELDAHLSSQEVGGIRTVRPDPEATRGQRVFTLLAKFGNGSPLRITPVPPSEIPGDADGLIYSSAPCIGAITVGFVTGRDGRRIPYDAFTAERDGHLVFCGQSTLDVIELFNGFRDLIEETRARFRGQVPAFQGGVAAELTAERARAGTSRAPTNEELERDLRALGASEDEIRQAFGDEAPGQSGASSGVRLSVPADRPADPSP